MSFSMHFGAVARPPLYKPPLANSSCICLSI